MSAWPFDQRRRDRVKRKKDKKETPRRLMLSRETIQILDQPSLLELARGGDGEPCPTDSVTKPTTLNDVE
jgi:hypothetical protein